jgi:glycerol-1-phosphate dehydrogenase [NAD(P)+]
VRIIVLSSPHGVHTTTELVGTVRDSIESADVVVSVGSGTITDISKHAVHEVESATGRRLFHIAVATANSVGAYTSGLAVVTTNGVKRTVPSRLPDRLVLDTTTLADTPTPYVLGGVGDGAVGWCSLADYRLASVCGMGRWEPLAPAVFRPGLQSFLDQDPAFTTGGRSTADAMARTLAAAGFVMTFAGESAPASGLEHVTSHMLDMSADYHGRSIGNHGEQCGLATALVLLAYRYLLDEFDPAQVASRSLSVDMDAAEALVRRVFTEIDPSGAMADECWRDYSAKCESWQEHAEDVRSVLDHWDLHRAELRALAAPPERYVQALAATGHPLSFEDVPPGLPRDQVRWAFANARLMRRRLSVADFLGFLGLWTDELVDRLFAEFDEICEQARG